MRVGIIGIAVYETDNVEEVNTLISENSSLVIGRMGLPLREQNMNLISLIVKGDTDGIGRLAGRIGSLSGVEIKSMLMKEHKDLSGAARF